MSQIDTPLLLDLELAVGEEDVVIGREQSAYNMIRLGNLLKPVMAAA